MAKRSVRDMWKAKLEGGHVAPSRSQPVTAGRRRFRGTILGVDPSLRGTGLAVIEFSGGEQGLLLHSETVRMHRSASMPACLGAIFRELTACCQRYPVDVVALEQTIHVQNFQTAQVLGAARGAAIAAAAVAGKPVFEYAPLRVKQAVVGVGRASKEQMAKTVRGLLGHGAVLSADEADAAGTALCHAFTCQTEAEV